MSGNVLRLEGVIYGRGLSRGVCPKGFVRAPDVLYYHLEI